MSTTAPRRKQSTAQPIHSPAQVVGPGEVAVQRGRIQAQEALQDRADQHTRIKQLVIEGEVVAGRMSTPAAAALVICWRRSSLATRRSSSAVVCRSQWDSRAAFSLRPFPIRGMPTTAVVSPLAATGVSVRGACRAD